MKVLEDVSVIGVCYFSDLGVSVEVFDVELFTCSPRSQENFRDVSEQGRVGRLL